MIINTEKNIILDNLSKEELYVFLKKINSLNLDYRRQLNLPSQISFGVEIEGSGLDSFYTEEIVEEFNFVNCLDSEDSYSMSTDHSVDFEVVSPILYDLKFNWMYLQRLCDLLKRRGATIKGNNASHIHLGTHLINTPDKLSWLIKTFVVFEDIIHKFGYGYYNEPRNYIIAYPNSFNYSVLMSPLNVKLFIEVLNKCDNISQNDFLTYFFNFNNNHLFFKSDFCFRNFNYQKFYNKVKEVPNEEDHMEVRCFNGTLSPEIIQNNINLVASIISCVANNKINKEYIEQEYQKFISQNYDFSKRSFKLKEEECKQYNDILFGFNEINLEKAIKLADMIFYTEIDKMYFLKQYLKLFNRNDDYVLSLTQ